MAQNTEIAVGNEDGTEMGHVRLPVAHKDLKDFVVGLLGRPQIVRRTIRQPFRVGNGEVLSLHDALYQRVERQNGAQLVRFISVIGLEDGSSIELNGINAITTHNEIKPVSVTSLVLEWVYLLQFPDKPAPEKQVVTVIFNAQGLQHRLLKGLLTIDLTMSDEMVPRGSMHVRLAHTERTWGADIDSLLDAKLRGFRRRPTRSQTALREWAGWIGLGTSATFLVGSVAGGFWATHKFGQIRQEAIAAQLQALPQDTIPALASRVDLLVAASASGAWSRHYLYLAVFLAISSIAAVVVGIWCWSKASYSPDSFILFSNQSKEDLNEALREEARTTRSFLITVAVSVVCGVLGNYCFYWLRCLTEG